MPVAVAVAVSWLLLGAHPDPRFRAGVFLHDAGKYAAAIKMYRELLADRPHDAATVYELALSLLANQQADDTIALINGELKTAGQSPRLYAVLAQAYDAKGAPDSARAALLKGIEVDPSSGELLYNLGVHYGSHEKWSDAIAAFTACAHAEPANPSGWWGLGRAYEAVSEPGRAAGAFARAALTRADPRRLKQAAERAVKLAHSPEALSRMLAEDDTYYSAVRAAGHLDALAHEVFRVGGDASAELWCGEHAAEVAAWKAWETRRAAAK